MCKNAIAACNDKNVWVRSVVYIFSPSVGRLMATKNWLSPHNYSAHYPLRLSELFSVMHSSKFPWVKKKIVHLFCFLTWHEIILLPRKISIVSKLGVFGTHKCIRDDSRLRWHFWKRCPPTSVALLPPSIFLVSGSNPAIRRWNFFCQYFFILIQNTLFSCENK